MGCFTGLAPVSVIGAAIATVDWRVSGIRQPTAVRRALVALGLSLGWGASLAGLLLASGWLGSSASMGPSAGWQAPRPGLVALTTVPLVFGVVPAGILVVLAWGPTSGTPDRIPTWRTVWHRWVEGRLEER